MALRYRPPRKKFWPHGHLAGDALEQKQSSTSIVVSKRAGGNLDLIRVISPAGGVSPSMQVYLQFI